MSSNVIYNSQQKTREFVALRTGEPLGIVTDLTGSDLKNLHVQFEVLKPGRKSSSPHRHTRKEEGVYVISGEPSVWIDGRVTRLQQGDFVSFDPADGKFHMVFNETACDATILISSCNWDQDETIFT